MVHLASLAVGQLQLQLLHRLLQLLRSVRPVDPIRVAPRIAGPWRERGAIRVDARGAVIKDLERSPTKT